MGFEDLTLKESSSIAAAAYDRDERTLRITFKPGRAEARGGRYDYLKVPPDVVDEFLDAESHGQFVNWRSSRPFGDHLLGRHPEVRRFQKQKAPAFPRGLLRAR